MTITLILIGFGILIGCLFGTLGRNEDFSAFFWSIGVIVITSLSVALLTAKLINFGLIDGLKLLAPLEIGLAFSAVIAYSWLNRTRTIKN